MFHSHLRSPRPALLTARVAAGLLCLAALIAAAPSADAADVERQFAVGTATRDITPADPVPMWGYGARHALLSRGTLDPLEAKAIVIHAGAGKLAIVGTDLGRGPTKAMMEKIRAALKEQAGIEHVLIAGSHTHHGPVIELIDEEGRGRGKFDAAVAYSARLTDLLIEAILAADQAARPARLGVAAKILDYNRNRNSKRPVKPTEPTLGIMRFDDLEGRPIAVLVNFAAHPVMLSGAVLQFSADYPGAMRRKVEADLATQCLFMQGAAGDMSPDPPPARAAAAGDAAHAATGDAASPAAGGEAIPPHVAFGEALADEVLALARAIETKQPARPAVRGRVDHFHFSSRVDFSNSVVVAGYGLAFFPELVAHFVDEFRDGITPELDTILLNGDIAIVGVSGEFFASHSTRLRERAYLPHTLFFGYCNGHHMYFPTIEAASDGGYGADPAVSPVEIGAGERMMDQALQNIYSLQGKLPRPKSRE